MLTGCCADHPLYELNQRYADCHDSYPEELDGRSLAKFIGSEGTGLPALVPTACSRCCTPQKFFLP
jgi:hypothetical protein